MRYQMTQIIQDTPEAQEAITLMRRHAGRMVLEAVTVGPPYRAERAVHTALHLPDHLDAQARRMLAITHDLSETQITLARPIASRKEWTEIALLLPSPDSPALDGTMLAGWISACLTVWYLPSRMAALLRCCAEDSERIADLATAGYAIRRSPSRWAHFRAWLRPPVWTGTPSLAPVPVVAAQPQQSMVGDAATPQEHVVEDMVTPAVDIAPDDAALAGWLRGVMAAGAAVSMPGVDGAETDAAHG